MKTQMKALIASAVVVILAFTTITGVTYSWFSDSEEADIDVTAGKVILDITNESIELYSWESGTSKLQTDKFITGGTANVNKVGNSINVILDNIAPGDKIVLKLKIEDTSTISCKYRYSITASNYYGFIDALNITADYGEIELSGPGYSEWRDVVSPTGTITVELPTTAGNSYQSGKINLFFTIEAYQSNAINTDAYVISSAEDLKLFAYTVNSDSGSDFKGKIVSLMADIDLNNEHWTPIGTSFHPFKGTFEGNNHTIKNLTTGYKWSNDVGFFGFTKEGEIRNLTIHNAIVTGYLEIGVVAGSPYTSKFTNISVTGHVEVNGYAYVGGVGGKNAYANWTDIKVDVDDSSYVKANSGEYRTYVGGVIGFMGEGSQTMKNISSNIDVIGSTCDVGGITGIAHYGNSFINCSSSGNVQLVNATNDGDQYEIGGIAGVWHNQTGYTVTFTDCSFTGTLTSKLNETPVGDDEFKNNGLVGREYGAGTGQLIINTTS